MSEIYMENCNIAINFGMNAATNFELPEKKGLALPDEVKAKLRAVIMESLREQKA